MHPLHGDRRLLQVERSSALSFVSQNGNEMSARVSTIIHTDDSPSAEAATVAVYAEDMMFVRCRVLSIANDNDMPTVSLLFNSPLVLYMQRIHQYVAIHSIVKHDDYEYLTRQ